MKSKLIYAMFFLGMFLFFNHSNAFNDPYISESNDELGEGRKKLFSVKYCHITGEDQGGIVSIGSTCVRGGNGCVKNPCPEGTSPTQQQ